MTKPAPEGKGTPLTLQSVWEAITANSEVCDLAPSDVSEESLINGSWKKAKKEVKRSEPKGP